MSEGKTSSEPNSDCGESTKSGEQMKPHVPVQSTPLTPWRGLEANSRLPPSYGARYKVDLGREQLEISLINVYWSRETLASLLLCGSVLVAGPPDIINSFN